MKSSDTYHGSGSPIMEQTVFAIKYDIESHKKRVKSIVGMTGDDRDVLIKNDEQKQEK